MKIRSIRLSKYWLYIVAVFLISVICLPIHTVTAENEGSFSVDLGISNVKISGITSSTARITWDTNSTATSEVYYDTSSHTEFSGYIKATTEKSLTENHDVVLTGLHSGTIYYFRIRSEIPDTEHVAISENFVFTTLKRIVSGGGGISPTIDTDLFGSEGENPISYSGEVLNTIEGKSEDGQLIVTIPKGTYAKEKDGTRLKSLWINTYDNPPDPPEDHDIIGLAYDFGPNGATFDPPITITWSYDPDTLGDIPEDSLVLAYYDETTEMWIELESVVDTENNTITARVPHFTIYAIIGELPEEEPIVEDEEPTVEDEEPTVEDEEPIVEEEEPIVEDEEPTVEDEEPIVEEEEPDEQPKKINPWPWIIVIIAAVLVGFSVYYLRKRGR